jgi:hypothetical protein
VMIKRLPPLRTCLLRRLHPHPGETRGHVHHSNDSIAPRSVTLVYRPTGPVLGAVLGPARRCGESVAG